MCKYILSVLCIGTQVWAGIAPDLREHIREANTDEFIPVIVVMQEKAGYRVQGIGYRERVINELKLLAKSSQKEVMSVISANPGKTKDVRALWIANSIAIKAQKELILKIASLPSVRFILWDKEIRWIFDDVSSSHKYMCGATDTSWGVKKIRAPEVWELGYQGAGIIIGILDTGIDYMHPDLQYRLWFNNDIPGDSVDNDGNGYIDDIIGYDFVDNDNDPMDGYIPHGTHVAGIVAGDGSSGTQTGVAPKAKLMALRVLGNFGTGEPSDILEGFQYAVANGAHIVNASLGFAVEGQDSLRTVFRKACEKALLAGVILSAAAGNGDGAGGHFDVPFDISSPADCPPPWYGDGGHSCCIATGATDQNDSWASFSSYGPTQWNISGSYVDYPYPPGLLKPEVTAPGVEIISTLSTHFGGGYISMSGTSQAAPHTAGVIALMLSKNPAITPVEIDYILESTAVELGPAGKDSLYGAGRIDAFSAVNAVPGVEESNYIGDKITLRVTPNPATKWVEFYFDSPHNDEMGVKIYDLAGRLVQTLKGTEKLRWDRKDAEGNDVESGLYFYQIETPQGRLTGKLVIIF